MKKFDHNADKELLQKSFEQEKNGIEKQLGEATARPELWSGFKFLRGLYRRHLALAGLSYALDYSDDTVKELWHKSATYIDQAINLGLVMDGHEYAKYLTLSCITPYTMLRKKLLEFNRDRFTHPGVDMAESGFLDAEAYREIVKHDFTTAHGYIVRSEQEMLKEKYTKKERNRLLIFHNIMKSVMNKDAAALSKTLIERHNDWAALFSNDEAYWSHAQPIIDYRVLGLLQVAREVGVEVKTDSAYLPVYLLP